MTAPYSGGGYVVPYERARAIAEWLAAEQKHLGQRTANMILNFWLDDVERMTATAEWLLAEAHWEHMTIVAAVTDAAEYRQKLTETRLRDARNELDGVRARITQADRAGLLEHRGEWPQVVVDAVARKMYGWPASCQLEGFMRFTALGVLAAAARAHGAVPPAPNAYTDLYQRLNTIHDAVDEGDAEGIAPFGGRA